MLSRGKAFLFIAAAQIASWIASSQNWYQVSMTPNDETVVLQSFDGFTVNSYTGPILSVTLAALAASLLTTKTARTITLWIGGFFSLALSALSGLGLSQQNLSGVATQIESATGIAATHGLTEVTITNLTAAPIGVGVFAVLGGFFAWSAISSSRWATKKSNQAIKTRTKIPTDAISLWDQQR